MRYGSLLCRWKKICGLGSSLKKGLPKRGVARWREQVLDNVSGIVELANGLPSLPHRFITTEGDFGIESDTMRYPPAVAAGAGLYLLSKYTGVDLYELLLASRQPERFTEAKREIVQTIEGVKKGLYKTLRDAEYSRGGFNAAYQAIIDTINELIEADNAG